ncbi:MAG TPA: hypothetical protein VFP31_01345 [Gaiellaceae bacterium]|nr:hypothetical protein [Gaiellaceae bacterium]
MLVLVPLLSVPLYLLGSAVANALDEDSSNGVFALGQILGVLGPAALAFVIASRRLSVAVAVVLGLVAGVVSAGVLLVGLAVVCSGTDC